MEFLDGWEDFVVSSWWDWECSVNRMRKNALAERFRVIKFQDNNGDKYEVIGQVREQNAAVRC